MILIGNRITRFERLDSTSNYVAKELDSGFYTEGTVILAHFQTEGRGQRGSQWQSNSGENLTFSFALDVEFLAMHEQFLIAKAVSVGISSYLLDHLESSVSIKWPNDILVGNRKISGMLIEIKGQFPKYAIIGVGLNVNQTEFSAGINATSLSAEKGVVMNIDHVLDQLLAHINIWISQLREKKYDLIEAEYRKWLYGHREWISFQEPSRKFTGMIQDVNNQGVMLVRSKQGGAFSFRPKEITINY